MQESSSLGKDDRIHFPHCLDPAITIILHDKARQKQLKNIKNTPLLDPYNLHATYMQKESPVLNETPQVNLLSWCQMLCLIVKVKG